MDMNEIEAIFFQECEEGLAGMESCFAELGGGTHDPETINTIFRHVHSIKGGAGAFGLDRLQKYAHEFESLLDLVRSGQIGLDDDLLSLLVRAFDTLSDHVASARDHSEAPDDAAMIGQLVARCEGTAGAAMPEPIIAEVPSEPSVPETGVSAGGDDFDDLMAMLDLPDFGASQSEPAPLSGQATTDTESEPVAPTSNDGDAASVGWLLDYAPGARAFANGGEPLLVLRELHGLGATELRCHTDSLPQLEAIEASVGYLRWTMALPAALAEADIRAVFEFLEPDCYTLSPLGQQSAADPQDFASPPAEPETLASAPVDSVVVAEPAPIASPEPVQAAAPAPEPAPVVAPAAPAAPRANEKPAAAPVSQTIRVDLDRLDRLVNLVGELVITQAMLSQRLLDRNAAHADELADLELLTRDLQESTMAIRAQPMKSVYSRIPRLIRDLEAETKKKVRIEFEGEMTEVDKTVIERIGEPLTHLIRNAVDHGLETTEGRIEAGKSAEGLIRLSATHQSGRIVIAVSDDGRGINRDKVRERAIERGIVHGDAVLSDEEIDQLIFAPGFSTAEVVSSISGRGVGMDVVRKNIQALGGRIAIASEPGKGSTFSLSLPLTLAVLDGMVVTVGDQTMVIPLSHVVENVRPTADTIEAYGRSSHLLNVRGSYVPIVSVAHVLGVDDKPRNPSECVLVVVDSDKGQVALMVDAINDQRQVVVKSLEANFQPIAGVAGATILGNGKVALIVDAHELVASHRDLRGTASLANAA